jgi:hypothetical protein
MKFRGWIAAALAGGLLAENIEAKHAAIQPHVLENLSSPLEPNTPPPISASGTFTVTMQGPMSIGGSVNAIVVRAVDIR